jgi:hypothetical protein
VCIKKSSKHSAVRLGYNWYIVRAAGSPLRQPQSITTLQMHPVSTYLQVHHSLEVLIVHELISKQLELDLI